MAQRYNSTVTGKILELPIYHVDEYANIESILEILSSSSTAKGTILVTKEIALRNPDPDLVETYSLTIPANVQLFFVRGGYISIPTDVELTIEGTILSGYHQIFAFDGDASVIINGTANPVFYPQWFSTSLDGDYNAYDVARAYMSIKEDTAVIVFQPDAFQPKYVAADEDVTISATDRVTGVTVVPRTVTLPSSAQLPDPATVGLLIWSVKDETGGASGNTITIQRNAFPGTDTIDGATSVTITTNYGARSFYYAGGGKFFTL